MSSYEESQDEPASPVVPTNESHALPQEPDQELPQRTKVSVGPGKVVLLVLGVCLFVVMIGGIVFDYQAACIKKYESPDGRYMVQVLAYPKLFAGPAQGGGPGKLRLVTRDGRPLDQAPISNVDKVPALRWQANQVDIDGVAVFELPPDESRAVAK
ncbi:MAG: hypothetical protein K2Y32_12815 [Candidatus Obscuribacterales bacterium]|nr:hypothetical protein [Candidatus Obscuribacterales bacterium]